MAKKEDVREKEKVIKKLDQNYPMVCSRKNTFPSSFMWFLAGLGSLWAIELEASVLGWLGCVCVCVCVCVFVVVVVVVVVVAVLFFSEEVGEI